MVGDQSGADRQLRRDLGLAETLSIVVGRIIGSGIFRTPGVMMAAVSLAAVTQGGIQIDGQRLSVGFFLLAWALGGAATILGALCYAELVALLPRSGGPYAYLRAAYPEFWTFLRGWAMFFVSETAAIVAVAIFFGETLVELLHNAGLVLPDAAEPLAALALIWLMSAANCFGVLLSGRTQNIISSLKLIALAAIVVVCFGAPGRGAAAFLPFWPESLDWRTMLGVAAALRYGFFAYSGWEGATYVAEEVRNPSRNLPLSLLFGIGGVMLIYFAVNVGYLYQLGAIQMIHVQKGVATAAMQQAVGVAGAALIGAAILLSAGGNVSTQVLVKARTWYAMARDGLLFQRMSRLHPRYGSPNQAILLQALWATLLLLFASYGGRYLGAGRSYDRVIDFFSFTSTIFNISTFAAVWVLRHKLSSVARPFRTPWLPLTLGLTLAIQVWFAALTLYDRPWDSLLGVALTASGLAYYRLVVIKRRARAGTAAAG
ncbi:MAG: amino acid permease [Leptospirales bacterium]|nr:amino acid permease [Leptospirales bacterium]